MTATTYLKTPLGTAQISGDENGISGITLIDNDIDPNEPIPEILKPAVDQINAYFSGELKNFNLNLNPTGTAFQKKVWSSLTKIPFGKTCSYMQMSKSLGNVKAIRAVAAANGKNPLWIVIPCHRVIGTNGSLTGYAGGLWRKKWLLEHEHPTSQQSLF